MLTLAAMKPSIYRPPEATCARAYYLALCEKSNALMQRLMNEFRRTGLSNCPFALFTFGMPKAHEGTTGYGENYFCSP